MTLTPADAARAYARGSGRQPESLILRACADYLRAAGWYVIRIQQGLGAHKGISDLICIRGGRVVFAECKTPRGRLSDWQEGFRRAVTTAGGEYVVLRSVEDAIALSEEARA